MTGTLGSRWDPADCALLLIDYQENVLAEIPEPARATLERNVRTVAVAAVEFAVPVLVTTVGVSVGLNRPAIPSLLAALPEIEPIDRSCINAWDDPAVLAAVEATGRPTMAMGGLVTSVALTYPALCAAAAGYLVGFVEDAVADITGPFHDAAVTRLVGAGAVARSTQALISGWAQAERRVGQRPTRISASSATRDEGRPSPHARELAVAPV